MKRVKLNICCFIIGIIVLTISLNPSMNNSKNIEMTDIKINNIFASNSILFSNVSIVSDGYQGSYWNDGECLENMIVVDNANNVHIVWQDETDGEWGTDIEIMYVKYTEGSGWSNVTVISDGYQGIYWNDGPSEFPSIAVDSSDNIHVVWRDDTDGEWGTDYEIMYVNYTAAIGWSNVTVISDGYQGIYWNDGRSSYPSIAISDSDIIYVVWGDDPTGIWGTDREILIANYTASDGWSNATVISDGYQGIYWNDGSSQNPAIAIDNIGNVHVTWEDHTAGLWGTNWEVMYVKYAETSGWSNVTVVSDGYQGSYWNDDYLEDNHIAVDNSNNVHVIWFDCTDGIWGTDIEVMHVKYTEASGWSNVTIISDGYQGSYWNDGESVYCSFSIDEFDNIHVVWMDTTAGEWGTDIEIMYANYTITNGWSNATVISDGYQGSYWNDGDSGLPSLAIDNLNNIHVVWMDSTAGEWGTDSEIMYTKIVSDGESSTPTPPTINTPLDVTYKEGSIGNNITWIATDENILTPTYIIYVNGTQNITGSWISEIPIVVNIDGLEIGSYNYTIVVYDGTGASKEDTVIVNVLLDIKDGIPGIPVYSIILLASSIVVYMSMMTKKKTKLTKL